MGTGVFRYRGKDRPAATYWRRRFVALVIGLAILALIAWALSGALNASAARPAATDGGSAAGQAGQGTGGSGPATGSAGAAGGPARSSQPATGGPGHAARGKSARASAASRGRPAGGAGRGPGNCPPGSVVLSLSSSTNSFGARELPVFDADVVSTSAATCAFNIGVRYVRLVIMAGRTRIWGSADCVGGQGSLLTDLQRGVPVVLPISWDRETSSPGCQNAPAQVPAGTYTATVIAGADVSNAETFRLR